MAKYASAGIPSISHLFTYSWSHLFGTVFKKSVKEAGDYANDFWQTVRDHWNREYLRPTRFFHDILSELPKVCLKLCRHCVGSELDSQPLVDRVCVTCRSISCLNTNISRVVDAYFGNHFTILVDAATPLSADRLYRRTIRHCSQDVRSRAYIK